MSDSRPKTLLPIPAGRSYDSVLHHFEVEKGIAKQLKAADRESRKEIYETMYDVLFEQVPDHPRLTRRADDAATATMNVRKMKLIEPFIRPDGNVLEFGAGDCRFSFELAKVADKVFAVDIADQIAPNVSRPDNFELVVYNGYDLNLPTSSIDTAFSDQLIEHLHPEDTEHHFRLVHKVLKTGGVYTFRTPHRLTGPHDVSRYFSEEAEGFHLKEWTYGDLERLLKGVGFKSIEAYWFGRGQLVRVPTSAFKMTEALLRPCPLRHRRGKLRYLLPGISMAAYK